jgi:hypothetical protein
MKVTLIASIILNMISFSNKLQCQNIEIKQKDEILVIKIDSTADYFIIYGVSSKNKYKIVTRKVDSDCKNVIITGKYDLTLMSMNENNFPKVMNRCDIHYGWGSDNIILNEPEWGCDIYLVDEIYGLCYTTEIEIIKQYEKWIEQHPLKSIRKGNRTIKNERKTTTKQ